jgi:Asp-tRNA(Asn)/Glu-tRNA(Gln) amidotransferase B subunit
MNIDINVIATGILTAAKGVFDKQWPDVQKYVESEAQMYAQRLASVAKLYADGIISQKRAKEHVALQNTAWETTLISVKGLSQLMIEAALNAAIKVIQGAVNKAIGFALL